MLPRSTTAVLLWIMNILLTSIPKSTITAFGICRHQQRRLLPHRHVCSNISGPRWTIGEGRKGRNDNDGRFFSKVDDPAENDTGTATSGSTIKRQQQMHNINWETANGVVQFSAYDGETLRTAALRRGIVSPHNGRAQLINCRGLGTCGTCAVELKSGSVHPAERNTKEQLRLSFPPHSGQKNQPLSLRLACQVQAHSDLEVVKRSGFWGQYYDELTTSEECQTYFGDMEFILDNRSPKANGNDGSGGRT